MIKSKGKVRQTHYPVPRSVKVSREPRKKCSRVDEGFIFATYDDPKYQTIIDGAMQGTIKSSLRQPRHICASG